MQPKTHRRLIALLAGVVSLGMPHAGRAQSNPNVQLRVVNGRPTVLEDGKPIVMAAYDNSILWRPVVWKEWVDHFIDSGVRVFHLTPWHYESKYGQSRFWTDEGTYPSPPPPAGQDDLTMERQAAYILSRVPDARFIVRLNAFAPTRWAEKNPGELQTDGAGKTYQPSWASKKYLDGVRDHYRNLVGWVETQTWGNRVLGYFIMPYGEGLTILSLNDGFFDHSPAMQRAWRGWLQEQYSSDTALQAAWGDANVQLATAPIPDDTALRAKIETLPYWPDPKRLRRERDYARLQRQLFGRYVSSLTSAVKGSAKRDVIVGLDAMKQPLLGWQHNEAFLGRGRNTSSFCMFLASGSIDVGALLDLPTLDALVTPADYTARGIGFAYEGEGLSDSLVLRGKSLVIENDARTWLSKEVKQEGPPLGSFMNPREAQAGLLRNSGNILSRGLFAYWTDIANGYYNDPAVQRAIRLDKDLLTRGTPWPHRETEHAIAVIIDDESLVYSNFTTGFQNLAVIQQRVEGLALAGIPYRLYLLSDLKKDNFPAYRCYLFPNLFKVDDATISLLKRKVLRDGNIAIFGPGTGITDGQTISAEGAQKLLQIPMKLHDVTSARRVRLTHDHSITRDKTLQSNFGDSLAYGPILAPDRALLAVQNVQVLGELVSSWQVNAPGLVLKEFGRGAGGNGKSGARGGEDYAVVFAAAIPLPPSLLRELARYGGCNVWVDHDAVVSASDSVVSLHSTTSGRDTIRLPRRYGKIFDGVTGRLIARDANRIETVINAPETKTYFLE